MFRRIDGNAPEPTSVAEPLVLVVAYRADEHLADCLRVLAGELRVLVVDNDAPAAESSGAKAVAEAAGADYVSAPANLGFAGGVNLGLRTSWDGRCDVLLLNPDARMTATDVRALAAALHRDSRLAAVGPQLVDTDGHPQPADWPLPSPGQVWCDALGLGRFWRGSRFVVGAALLVRGAALAELGGLDERYFLYAEEADWQLRAQRSGWDVGVVSSVTAVHAGGASSADGALRSRQFHSSGALFASRWYGPAGRLAMRAGSFAAIARRTVAGSSATRHDARRTVRELVARPPRDGGEPS